MQDYNEKLLMRFLLDLNFIKFVLENADSRVYAFLFTTSLLGRKGQKNALSAVGGTTLIQITN